MTDAVTVVSRFNDSINGRDLDGLATLMSDDHRFVDSAGNTVSGKVGCLEAWRGFFAAFPTYRNVFECVHATDDTIVITGHSLCTDHPDLAGPAVWTAVVNGERLSEWRVHEDTAQLRSRLGIE